MARRPYSADVAAFLTILLLFSPQRVTAEGAGSALADAGQCSRMLKEMKDSPVGVIIETGNLIVLYNSSLYGSNGTRFVGPNSGADPTLTLGSSLGVHNSTLFKEGLANMKAARESSVIEDARQMVAEDSGEPLRSVAAPALVGESDVSVAEQNIVVDNVIGDQGPVVQMVDSENNLTVIANVAVTENNQGELIEETVIELSENFTLAWGNGTFEDVLLHEVWGQDANALAGELKERLLPDSCSAYEIVDNVAGDAELNDTIVTTAISEDGSEVLVTCVTTVESLENQQLRVHVIGDETEAYLRPEGTMGGYVGKSFEYIRSVVKNLTYDFRNLTLDALEEYPLSPWSACVSEIGRGYLDLCIGEFYDTPERREVSEFSGLLQLKAIVLIGPASQGAIDFSRLLRPFTPGLWGGIVLVIVAFAVLLWAFSYKRETNNFSPEFNQWKRFGHSVHLSLQSMLGAALATDLEEPIHSVYWLGTGYAVFIVVIVAAYTANLAAILSAPQEAAVFTGIKDIISRGYPVCVQESLEESTRVLIGEQLHIIPTDSVESSLQNIDNHICAAAIIQRDAMYYQPEEQCSTKALIGDVLFNIPTGVPVRQRYEGLISRHVSDLRVKGYISEFYTEMIDDLRKGECQALNPAAMSEDGQSLSFYNSVPLFVVVLALFVIAAGVHAVEWYYKRTKVMKQLEKAAQSVADTHEIGLPAAGSLQSSMNSEGTTPHGSSRDAATLEALLKQSMYASHQQLSALADQVAGLTAQVEKLSSGGPKIEG